MARDTSKLVTIPGELHSAATGNIVAASEEIFDYTANKYQKDINQEVASSIQDLRSTAVKITWSELRTLRDNSQLVAGTWYRITDYTCTTTQEDTRSAGHPFDIIVRADSENKLNEEAYAIQHEGDTYFANSNLSAWKLWYRLDNDTTRFAWADSAKGKGVIYRMIDEFNNDVPYDFKNIQFKRYILDANDAIATDVAKNGELDAVKYKLREMSNRIHTSLWYYGEYVTDVYPDAEEGRKYVPFGDIMYNGDGPGVLCSINEANSNWLYTFSDTSFNDSTITTHGGIHNNIFKNNQRLLVITEGEGKYSFVEQENICLTDIIFIGNFCYYNSFGNGCHSNSFGYNCNSNSFGNGCNSNSFGYNCCYNSFGNNCYYNSFGGNCYSNSFGGNCYYNSFGGNCRSNSFGNNCQHINFASDDSASTKYNYYRYNHFGDGCYYIVFRGAETASDSVQVQNYKFAQGLQGTSSAYLTIDGVRNRAYETKVAKNSDGEVKVYCEGVADSINQLKNAGYLYAGIATIDTTPGTLDTKIFYIANGKGTYTNFGGVVVTEDEVVILYYDTTWHKEATGIASQEKLYELAGKVNGKQDALIAGDSIKIEDNVISSIIAVKITWSELRTLRDNSQLVAGTWYRITDYTCTTTQEDTRSAGHPFDIIVRADSENKLNEEAYAIQHEGDTYFANSNLSAWKLWYRLDNDTTRFAWADSAKGKGVIYRMIDEFNNDVPYDFKNIQFKRYILDANDAIATDVAKNGELDAVKYKLREMSNRIHTSLWYYGEYVTDVYPDAEEGRKYVPFGDIMYNGDGPGVLCSINEANSNWLYTFSDTSFNDSTITTHGGIHNNIFKNNQRLLVITEGEGKYSFVEQENICLTDIIFIGNFCYYNSFGNGCHSNSFGYNCNSNSFGNGCNSNSFGYNCCYNSFGNNCYYNSFGGNCYSNSFGGNCYYNSFGGNCRSNSFGNNCQHINFASDDSASTKYNYYRYNHFGDGCYYIVFRGAETASDSVQVQNYKFAQGLQGTSSAYLTIDGVRNRAYETKVAKNSDGEVKVYCEADLIQ